MPQFDDPLLSPSAPTPPEPAPTPAPAPAPAPEPSSPPAVSGLREVLTQRGYDTSNFSDDSAVAEALIAAAEQYQANQRYIQLGQAAAPEWERYQAWREQQQPAAQPSPQFDERSSPEKRKWEPPKYDPRWEAVCEPDPQRPGYFRPADPLYAPAAQKLNDYKDWQRQTFSKLIENPLEILDQAGLNDRLAEIETRLVEKYQRALQDYDALQQQRQYVASNVSQFFQVDETGRPKFDGGGQPVLTPLGRAFEFYEAEARQFGLSDPMVVQRYVERQLEADRALGRIPGAAGVQPQQQSPEPPPPPPPPTPREAGRQKQERFVDRAMQIARNRNGTEHPGEPDNDDLPSQNPDAGLVEMAHREMRKRGMLPQKG